MRCLTRQINKTHITLLQARLNILCCPLSDPLFQQAIRTRKNEVMLLVSSSNRTTITHLHINTVATYSDNLPNVTRTLDNTPAHTAAHPQSDTVATHSDNLPNATCTLGNIQTCIPEIIETLPRANYNETDTNDATENRLECPPDLDSGINRQKMELLLRNIYTIHKKSKR